MKLPKNQEPLEPKAPETLQKLKWLRLYGWRHKWYVLIGIVLIGITFLNFGVLKRLAGFTSFHNHLSTEESVPKKKKFLTTHETPNEILNILGDYPSPDDRRREAYALFIDRWLQEPWVGTVCSTPERTEDQEGWSFRLMTYSKSGKGSSLNIVDTKQDASSLREGMQIRVTGRITGDLILGLSLKEATFEVVQLSTEESIPQKKIFLTTHERPDQIIEVLDQYSGSDRKKKASDLYIGRWLQEPWIGIVSRNPEKFEDGDEW